MFETLINYYSTERDALELKKTQPDWSDDEISEVIADEIFETIDLDWRYDLTEHVKEFLKQHVEKKNKRKKS